MPPIGVHPMAVEHEPQTNDAFPHAVSFCDGGTQHHPLRSAAMKKRTWGTLSRCIHDVEWWK